MRVQIRPRGPSAVKLKFTLGLPGPQGIQGIQGSLWYSGNGIPSGASYRIGDWYLNIANGDVYEKTADAAWTLRDNLTGPQGLQGIQGIQGLKGDQGIQGIQGIQGGQGDKGWSPVLAVVADSTRRVLQVIDWTGGAGTKPTSGSYIGATGLVAAIANAVDIRGPAGPPVSADSIDNTFLANMATNTIKGRVAAGTGDPEDLTPAQALAILGLSGLKKLDVIALASASPVADLTVPVGAMLGRFRGVAPNGNAAAVWLQAAFDAVPTFKSGASDYNAGLETTNTTPGTTTSTTIGAGAWPLSSTGSNTGVPVEFEGHVYVGTTASDQIPRYGVKGSVFDATNGHRILKASGFISATVTGNKGITAIRFRLASGSLPVGTFIVVEWF